MHRVRHGGRCAAMVAIVLVVAVCIGVWRGTGAPAHTSAATSADEGAGGDGGAYDDTDADDGISGDVPEGRVSDVPSDEPDVALPSTLSEDGAQTVVWVEQGGVEQVATRLLATYRDGEPCVLCQAGYLDLLGRVWSCVVQGDGWVDVCVVKQTDGTSKVTVMRLDDEQAAAVLGGEEG